MASVFITVTVDFHPHLAGWLVFISNPKCVIKFVPTHVMQTVSLLIITGYICFDLKPHFNAMPASYLTVSCSAQNENCHLLTQDVWTDWDCQVPKCIKSTMHLFFIGRTVHLIMQKQNKCSSFTDIYNSNTNEKQSTN